MANLLDIRTMTRELIGDSVMSQTWTDAQLNKAINDACLNYFEKIGVGYMEVLLPANSQGMVTLPLPYIDVKRVIYEWANS